MTSLNDLETKLSRRRREVDYRMGQVTALEQRKTALEAEIETLDQESDVYTKAAAVLNTIGETKQAQAQAQIEALVTQGLNSVFVDDNYSFHVVQTVRAKRPEVDFVVRKTLANGRKIDTDAMKDQSGGVSQVVGFLIRLIVLLLSKKKGDLLILDETFSFLSDEFVPAMGEFIKELVEKTGIQVIMVTHHPDFALHADKKYRFRLINGITQVTELKD